MLRPSRVYDGTSTEVHTDWVVVVRGEKIEAVGPAKQGDDTRGCQGD